MKKILLLLALMPFALACVNDGICTQDELGQGCIDCRTSSVEEDVCIDDGLCTQLEQNHSCQDCEETGIAMPSGLSVFLWGSGALGLGIVIVIALVALYISEQQKKKQPRLKRKSRL